MKPSSAGWRFSSGCTFATVSRRSEPGRIRAVRKERKLYFWDWSRVADRGSRFENMVAGHLLKYCHYVEDTEGHDMELRFIRDTDKREVDFVVLRDGAAEFAVECKSGEQSAGPACRYFRERAKIPRFYQVHMGARDFGNADANTRVLPFWDLLPCSRVALETGARMKGCCVA